MVKKLSENDMKEIENVSSEINFVYNMIDKIMDEIFKYIQILSENNSWMKKYKCVFDVKKYEIKVVEGEFNENSDLNVYGSLDDYKSIYKFYKKNMANSKLLAELTIVLKSMDKDKFFCFSYGILNIFEYIFYSIKNLYEGKEGVIDFIKNKEFYENFIEKFEEILSVIKFGVVSYEEDN
ncbi:MAG: hypothetical protein QW038_02800 [Nanopusillaceae archaeon]